MNDKKGVLRSTTTMLVFVGLVGMWMVGCQKLTQEQKEIKRLIKQLGHKNSDVRMTAAGALGSIGSKDAVPALIQALQDEHVDVRVLAAGALGSIRSEDAVPALIPAFQNDQNVRVRHRVADTLGSIGSEDAVPTLIQALQDQDAEGFVRMTVAGALGSIGSKDAVPALIQALQDQDKWVRVNTAEALGKIGSEDAVPALIQLLQGSDEDVDYLKDWLVLGPFPSADLEFDFLTDIGGERNLNPKAGQQVKAQDGQILTWRSYRSKEAIVNLLEAIGKFENVTVYAYCEIDNEELKKHGYIGSDDGVAVWINGQLVHKNNAARGVQLDQDLFEIDTKKDSNRCLVKITQGGGDWGFALRFSDDLNEHVDVRVLAAGALGSIGSEAAVPALIQALQDQYSDVRNNATGALGRIGKDAVPALIQALQDQNLEVRFRAAYALRQIGTSEAIKAAVSALMQLFRHQNKYVRVDAAGSLGQIGTPEAIKAAVPALIHLLQDQDVNVRRDAAGALGQIGEGAIDAVPALIHLLQDQDVNVRREAAGALGQIGTPEALKAVEEYQSRFKRGSTYG